MWRQEDFLFFSAGWRKKVMFSHFSINSLCLVQRFNCLGNRLLSSQKPQAQSFKSLEMQQTKLLETKWQKVGGSQTITFRGRLRWNTNSSKKPNMLLWTKPEFWWNRPESITFFPLVWKQTNNCQCLNNKRFFSQKVAFWCFFYTSRWLENSVLKLIF